MGDSGIQCVECWQRGGQHRDNCSKGRRVRAQERQRTRRYADRDAVENAAQPDKPKAAPAVRRMLSSWAEGVVVKSNPDYIREAIADKAVWLGGPLEAMREGDTPEVSIPPLDDGRIDDSECSCGEEEPCPLHGPPPEDHIG